MILKGDCIEVMKAMKSNSVHAIVTDPPYGLGFMNKHWDTFSPEYQEKMRTRESKRKPRKDGRKVTGFQESCYAGSYDFSLKGNQKFQKDMELWLTEAYRVLKLGGSMLVMGGTRTSHRLACAIEDSGFIIKDTLMWIYGSGFPKAQDLGKMIDNRMGAKRKEVGIDKDFLKRNPKDNANGIYESGLKDGIEGAAITVPTTDLVKHWDGFKVGGIKPAYEPIIWAVKPPEGSYVDNVLRWGVGAVNVDGCRIGVESDDNNKRKATGKMGGSDSCFGVGNKYRPETLSKGRFPANVILSHHPECVQMGVKKTKSQSGGIGKTRAKSHFQRGEIKSGNFYADKDGLETVESWNCHPDCAVKLLDEQSGMLKSGGDSGYRKFENSCFKDKSQARFIKGVPSDSGGASRFFYCAKASRGERNAGLGDLPDKLHGQSGGATQALKEGKTEYLQEGHIGLNKIKIVKNNHPTVKPIKLFEWLIKLVTREGQIILDPFIGSGTTGIAAHNTGRKYVGIEKEEEYIEIAKRRVAHWRSQPKQLEII